MTRERIVVAEIPEALASWFDAHDRAVEMIDFPENPLHDYLREHGQAYEYARFDGSAYPQARRTKKECFHNALDLAITYRDLTYVEGMASSLIPVHHAWTITNDGKVQDPTWDDDDWRYKDESFYFGVEFDTVEVAKLAVQNDAYGHIFNVLGLR
jgi:hypothetical protein